MVTPKNWIKIPMWRYCRRRERLVNLHNLSMSAKIRCWLSLVKIDFHLLLKEQKDSAWGPSKWKELEGHHKNDPLIMEDSLASTTDNSHSSLHWMWSPRVGEFIQESEFFEIPNYSSSMLPEFLSMCVRVCAQLRVCAIILYVFRCYKNTNLSSLYSTSMWKPAIMIPNDMYTVGQSAL